MLVADLVDLDRRAKRDQPEQRVGRRRGEQLEYLLEGVLERLQLRLDEARVNDPQEDRGPSRRTGQRVLDRRVVWNELRRPRCWGPGQGVGVRVRVFGRRPGCRSTAAGLQLPPPG